MTQHKTHEVVTEGLFWTSCHEILKTMKRLLHLIVNVLIYTHTYMIFEVWGFLHIQDNLSSISL